MRALVVMLSTVLGPFTQVSQAESIGWSPSISFKPGNGLNIRQQKLSLPPVAVFTETNAFSSGSPHQNTVVHFVQHALDISRSLHVNANLSLDSTFASGKVGFDFADQQSFSGNTINFVFDCSRDFGIAELPFVSFTADFTNAVNDLKNYYQGDALLQQIENRFGSHVIYGYHSVAKAIVVFQLQYGSTSVARQTSASVAASYSDGVDGGSFSSFVSSEFSQTDK